MRLAVDSLSRFLVGGFGKAEDLSRLLVEPVPMILNPVLVLDLFVLPVGGDLLGRLVWVSVVTQVRTVPSMLSSSFAVASSPSRVLPMNATETLNANPC